MDTHFMINLNTSRLHDKFKDIRYPCPAEITSELEELRHYVRRKVARENQVRRDVLAENQARSRRRLEGYYIRLADSGFIDLDDIGGAEKFSDQPWYGKCPLHKLESNARLVSCRGCGMMSCNLGCDGFYMDKIRSCELHPQLIYCPTCRSGEGRSAKLVMCPGNQCGEAMYCPRDLEWCMGPPAHSDSDAETTYTRSHSPTPIVCHICTEVASDFGIPPMHCSNDECWSEGKTLCDDCCSDGISCSKCSRWICDECEATGDQATIWQCRECKEAYCYECHAMDPCIGCGVAGLCHECSATGESAMPSETDDSNMSSDDEEILYGLPFQWECEACNNQMCSRCVDNGVPLTCQGCGKSVCGHCTTEEGCLTCQTG